MISNSVLERPEERLTPHDPSRDHWAFRAHLLWKHRRLMARVTAISLLVSLGIAFAIPKRYKSSASIMPPDQQNSNALMLAALASHAPNLGSIGSLASGLLGGHSSTALFINLLESGTVSGHLIDRFDLQHVYHNRYRVDTAKHLAHCTKISDDKKSGVITIEVEDESPVRARDLAQAYLDELNKLVTQTNVSSAHQERVFIEQRLKVVQADLEQAQVALSEYSSKTGTIEIGDQARAMMEGGSRVQAELLIEQSTLESLRQMYGDDNVRVREAEARIASLERGLKQMTGTGAAAQGNGGSEAGNGNTGTGDAGNGSAASGDVAGAADDSNDLYPSLRQLPRLAVPYADLYRRVKAQEAAFELLTQQYELARLEEARDVPAVSVIDAPGIPEKKSFPPRLLLAALLTFFCVVSTAALILFRDYWSKMDSGDPRKSLADEVLPVLRRRFRGIFFVRRYSADRFSKDRFPGKPGAA
jgi:capsule polysaccharide export protein KpsE/RkpR